MPDDLRLAVTVEADLSKLDMSLANALQKVSTAGNRMQQAARFDITNGNVGSTASAAFPTGADGFKGVTGYNSVSFGSANMGGGNGNRLPFNPGLSAVTGGSSSVSQGGYGFSAATNSRGVVLGSGLNVGGGNINSNSSFNAVSGGGNSFAQGGFGFASSGINPRGAVMGGGLNVGSGNGNFLHSNSNLIASGGGGNSFAQGFGFAANGINPAGAIMGGGLNARGGNGQSPINPVGTAANLAYEFVSNIGIISAGVAAMVEQMKVGTAAFGVAQGGITAYGYHGINDRVSLMGQANMEQSFFRNIPILGSLGGAGIDFQRAGGNFASNTLRDLGFSGLGNKGIEGNQSASDQLAILDQLRNNTKSGVSSFYRGGYLGQIQNSNSDRSMDEAQLEATRTSISDNQYKSLKNSIAFKYDGQLNNLRIDRAIDISDIQSSTKQLGLRAAGMGGFADIEAINQSFNDQVLNAGPDGTKVDLLNKQRRAAITAQMFQNIGPGQEISPTNTALGPNSVRIGSISGQDQDIKDSLTAIVNNTGRNPAPQVARH